MRLSLNSSLTNLKSLIFNFRYLPIKKAIHLPIRIYPGFKVKGLKAKNLILPESLSRGMIFLGAPPTEGLPGCSGGMIICKPNATLKFNGKAFIRKGTTIRIDKNGSIEIGDEVYINGNCFIRSDNSIIIEDKCRIGWDVTINTTDGHSIIIDGVRKERSKSIMIRQHCWIGNHCCISKGVCMEAGSVLAQYSLLTKSFPEKKLLGGIPAKVIRENIEWE